MKSTLWSPPCCSPFHCTKQERKKERRKSRKSTVWLSHYRLITVKKSFGQYLQVSFLGYCNLFSNFILLDWCCRECSCEEHIGCGSPPPPPPMQRRLLPGNKQETGMFNSRPQRRSTSRIYISIGYGSLSCGSCKSGHCVKWAGTPGGVKENRRLLNFSIGRSVLPKLRNAF